MLRGCQRRHLFKFGEDFKRWVKVFYTDIFSCVINNAFASPSFKLKRGVTQGCPLSELLFVLAIELLALAHTLISCIN